MPENMSKIIVFGASSGGEAFISNNDNYEIVAIADNDEKKQGKTLCGYPIISPSEIMNYEYEYIIIASSFIFQIRKQLLNEFKIDPNKIKEVPKSMIGTKKTYRPFEDKHTIDLARNVLLTVVEILEEKEIRYFIDHGTLLGIVRDGDIIPWDDDIDISIHEDDIDKTVCQIKRNISKLPNYKELNWNISIYYGDKHNPELILLTFIVDESQKFNSFHISLEVNHFVDGLVVQSLTYAPEYHFKTSEDIEYRGKLISVPYDYKKYLEFHYGDWKTPKKDISFSDISNYKEPKPTYKVDC